MNAIKWQKTTLRKGKICRDMFITERPHIAFDRSESFTITKVEKGKIVSQESISPSDASHIICEHLLVKTPSYLQLFDGFFSYRDVESTKLIADLLREVK